MSRRRVRRFRPEGVGWIKIKDEGSFVVWMRPEPDGALRTVMYTPDWEAHNDPRQGDYAYIWDVTEYPGPGRYPYWYVIDETVNKPHRFRMLYDWHRRSVWFRSGWWDLLDPDQSYWTSDHVPNQRVDPESMEGAAHFADLIWSVRRVLRSDRHHQRHPHVPSRRILKRARQAGRRFHWERRGRRSLSRTSQWGPHELGVWSRDAKMPRRIREVFYGR